MLRKFHEAKEKGDKSVTLWGTGSPRREFLHADDLADACLFIMNSQHDAGLLNIGVGEDVTIKELAELIKTITGFNGEINWDTSRPDGTPRTLMDVTRLKALGWKASIPLQQGIEKVYRETFVAVS
jgi:GDP-L-fucose synthase